MKGLFMIMVIYRSLEGRLCEVCVDGFDIGANAGRDPRGKCPAAVDADKWPDDTVLLDLDRRAVCSKCGIIGADVRTELE
jgi:hypothetical protein